VPFEKLAERRLVAEKQFVCHLFDAGVRFAEQRFGFGNE
jgi:hypothetical protein